MPDDPLAKAGLDATAVPMPAGGGWRHAGGSPSRGSDEALRRTPRRVVAGLLTHLLTPARLPRLVAAADALALAAGFGLAAALGVAVATPGPVALPWLATVFLLMALLGAERGAYRHATLFRAGDQLDAILPAGAAAILLGLLFALGGAVPPGQALRWALAAGCGLALVAASRAAFTWTLRRPAAAGAALPVVVIGPAGATARLVAALRREGPCGYRVVARLAETPAEAEPVFGMLRRGEAAAVIIATGRSLDDASRRLLRQLADWPVPVWLAPDITGCPVRPNGLARIGGATLVAVSDQPIRGWQAVAKRGLDLGLSLLGLVITAAPMALIALAIRLESPGPVLFRQRRTGFCNRDFEMLKFRTMFHDMSDADVRQQVSRGDKRVTRVGVVLRRTSLDELPQILNVLRGEMSLVGPRPQVASTLAGRRRFDDVAARYAARHRVRPGLTGLAQVRGLRGRTDTEEKLLRRLESDFDYIDGWSLRRDLSILLRTVFAVLLMRNAL